MAVGESLISVLRVSAIFLGGDCELTFPFSSLVFWEMCLVRLFVCAFQNCCSCFLLFEVAFSSGLWVSSLPARLSASPSIDLARADRQTEKPTGVLLRSKEADCVGSWVVCGTW